MSIEKLIELHWRNVNQIRIKESRSTYFSKWCLALLLKIPEKYGWMGSCFSKIASCRYAALLKMNSFTSVFHIREKVQNSYSAQQVFAEHLLLWKNSRWPTRNKKPHIVPLLKGTLMQISKSQYMFVFI